jgi:hypothetical protein
LALWLIAGQMILFSAAGFTHSHVVAPGGGDPAGALLRVPTASSAHASVQALADPHPGGAAHCAICQVARSTVASIAAAQRLAVPAILCDQTASDLPAILSDSPIGPCSTRAPPIA